MGRNLPQSSMNAVLGDAAYRDAPYTALILLGRHSASPKTSLLPKTLMALISRGSSSVASRSILFGGMSSDSSTAAAQVQLPEPQGMLAVAHSKLAAFKQWQQANIGLQLIAASQLFFSGQTLCVKILQDENGMPVMQIVFVRMIITATGCFVWLKASGDPNPLLGPPDVRKLLVLRGTLGFFGLTGMYNSLKALSLPDATTLSFLSPTVTAILGYIILKESLARKELVAGLISLLGVILISRPPFIFGTLSDPREHYSYGFSPESASRAGWSGTQTDKLLNESAAGAGDVVTPHERMVAVGWALVGVAGASGAYTTIRAIGKRAHPLHSISYFAIWCTIVSSIAMVGLQIAWVVPSTALGWAMLLGIGLSGFGAQILITMGLQREKAGRASLAMYLQILFSLFFERVVFHNYPPALSLLGTVVILSSALYVAFTGEKPKPDDIEFQQIPSSDPDEPSQSPPVRRRPSRAFSYAAVPSGADVGFEAESPADEGEDGTGGGDAKTATGLVDMERKEYPGPQ